MFDIPDFLAVEHGPIRGKKGSLSRDTVDENTQFFFHAGKTVSVTTPSPIAEVFVGGTWWSQNKSGSRLELNRCSFSDYRSAISVSFVSLYHS